MLPEQMSRVELPASFFRKVPARKAMQIESFARRLSLPPSQLLEWCAGKAHLGRLLARLYGHEMTGVELREELCEVGNELACVHHLPVRLHAQDVMAEGVARWLVGMDGVIGLHACGRLHRRLMEVSVKEGVDSIHLAPCCYFLDEDGAAYGCSRHARQSGLVIKKAHIRLVTQERVIASDRRDTLRLRGLQWRLGFDELQREVWGGESYMKVPSVTRKILRGDFRGFCEHVARVSGRELPHTLDVERYAQEGMKRYRQFRPFEIVRGVFRRPLELLLVLDRALYLEEAGYRVNVGIFCEKHWTPRNLMLQAYILG
ncbi:MAG: methyltransferase [Deltaproteobacteria bacterium]|nr:methyltransferase [Deltaproteobacteria bacterium]|tara:strand:- start:1999 stop:2946 length:948 start_codon:yes stop_codon:yes gene_type:complete